VIKIRYTRRALCAVDDAKNGRFDIEMLGDAALGDLILITESVHGKTPP
jgi:hypothetical protein